MGYIKHHAIVVTSWNRDAIFKAHFKATEIFKDTVSNIVDGMINGYMSFFVGPDGSKEGWTDSDKGDENRAAFIEWVNEQAYEDGSNKLAFVEVWYGEDNREAKIENHN